MPAKMPTSFLWRAGAGPGMARARGCKYMWVRVPAPEPLEAAPTLLAMTLFVDAPLKGRSFR